MKKTVLALVTMLYLTPAQASLWDDVMSWFSGDEEETQPVVQEEAPARPAVVPMVEKAEPAAKPDLVESAVRAAAPTAVRTGMALLPMVTQSMGVTEAQAKGGLGAIFMAAKATLAPEDYKLIADAVPDINSYISAAPPSNQLVSGAMGLLGGSQETAAAANLLAQFNDLGLGADMIAGFSQQAAEYIKGNSEAASEKLLGVVSEYL